MHVLAFYDPVIWEGKAALMFFNRHAESIPRNDTANQLLNYFDQTVRGRAYIVTNVEKRFKMRVWAELVEIKEAIENLGLSAPPVIVDSGGMFAVHDIYAATREDLFAIRMCL